MNKLEIEVLSSRKQRLIIQRSKLLKQLELFERSKFTSTDTIETIKSDLKTITAKLEEIESILGGSNQCSKNTSMKQ